MDVTNAGTLPSAEPQTVLYEVQRIDSITGVVVQTGFAVTAAAITVAATGAVPAEVSTALVVAGAVCIAPTVIACAALLIDLPLSGPESQLEIYAAYRRKRRRCRAALYVLAFTIEIAAGLIGLMAAT